MKFEKTASKQDPIWRRHVSKIENEIQSSGLDKYGRSYLLHWMFTVILSAFLKATWSDSCHLSSWFHGLTGNWESSLQDDLELEIQHVVRVSIFMWINFQSHFKCQGAFRVNWISPQCSRWTGVHRWIKYLESRIIEHFVWNSIFKCLSSFN